MRAIVLVMCCLAALLVSFAARGEKKEASQPAKERPDPFSVLRTLKTGGELTYGIAFSSDSKVLAVAQDGRITFWEPRTGKPAAKPWKIEADFNVRAMAFVNATTLAVACDAKHPVVYEYPSGKTLATLELGKMPHIIDFATSLAVADNVIVAAGQSAIRAWAGPDWKEQWHIKPANGDFPLPLALSPDRSELAVGITGDRGRVQIHSMKDGKVLYTAGDGTSVLPYPSGLAYTPDGRLLAITPTRRPDPDSDRGDDVFGLALFNADLTEQRVAYRWASSGGQLRWCAFTPDGKTLLVTGRNSQMRLYEVQTSGLRHVGGIGVGRQSFSPDGRLLAVGSDGDREPTFIDWRAAKPGAAAPTGAALDSLWADLASSDSAKGYQAVVALGAHPALAVRLLGERLKSASAPNAGAVKNWIADLSSDDFAAREAAEKELAKLGDAIEPELCGAAKSDVPERRDRAARLVKTLSRRDAPERLRILRAVEVLEYADTPAGRDVLKALADGAPAALLTRDATAALARLKALDPKP